MPSIDLEAFADRSFAFYPPIRNTEHNEWRYQKGTWSEVLVRNVKTQIDIWVPRRYLHEIDRIEDPIMIVGLTAELEYSGGAVWPHKRRVLEMPSASRRRAPSVQPAAKDSSPPPSRDSAAERKVGRLILVSLVVFIGLAALTVFLTRRHETGGTITYQAVLQHDLDLNASDDYNAVVRKLGPPAASRWRPGVGERQFQALDYPALGITAILMGPDQKDQHYIGAKDANWVTVHSITLPSGRDSASMLRALDRF